MAESEEGTEKDCPLCCNALDATDKGFKPCQCGFQLCAWCWHHLMELAAKDSLPARCPNCRLSYDKKRISFSAPSQQELERLKGEKKREKVRTKSEAKEPQVEELDRRRLQDVRVLQRNLVYIIGLTMPLCREETLRRSEYFGKYGKIVKVSVNRNCAYHAGNRDTQPTGSACVPNMEIKSDSLHVPVLEYVTYARDDDSLKCIQAVDGMVLDGKMLRACFGTTKYCSAFLRYLPCSAPPPNSLHLARSPSPLSSPFELPHQSQTALPAPCDNTDCLFLHGVGNDDDSYTKEEMLARYGTKQPFHEATHAVPTRATTASTGAPGGSGSGFAAEGAGAGLLRAGSGTGAGLSGGGSGTFPGPLPLLSGNAGEQGSGNAWQNPLTGKAAAGAAGGGAGGGGGGGGGPPGFATPQHQPQQMQQPTPQQQQHLQQLQAAAQQARAAAAVAAGTGKAPPPAPRVGAVLSNGAAPKPAAVAVAAAAAAAAVAPSGHQKQAQQPGDKHRQAEQQSAQTAAAALEPSRHHQQQRPHILAPSSDNDPWPLPSFAGARLQGDSAAATAARPDPVATSLGGGLGFASAPHPAARSRFQFANSGGGEADGSVQLGSGGFADTRYPSVRGLNGSAPLGVFGGGGGPGSAGHAARYMYPPGWEQPQMTHAAVAIAANGDGSGVPFSAAAPIGGSRPLQPGVFAVADGESFFKALLPNANIRFTAAVPQQATSAQQQAMWGAAAAQRQQQQAAFHDPAIMSAVMGQGGRDGYFELLRHKANGGGGEYAGGSLQGGLGSAQQQQMHAPSGAADAGWHSDGQGGVSDEMLSGDGGGGVKRGSRRGHHRGSRGAGVKAGAGDGSAWGLVGVK